MNDTNHTSPPEPPYKRPNNLTDPDYAPIDEQGFSHILNHLLKKPLSIIYEMQHGKRSPLPALLIITLVSLGIFGFVLGLFSAGTQLWAAPVKVIGGVLFSGIICLPSLYIFGSLGGMNARLQDVAGLMLTFLAITSLLLVGFAPVVWLFSTSSNSLIFFGFLSLIIWMICLAFGVRVISRANKSMGGSRGGHLQVWAFIFILVTIQMTTTLRPIIGTSEDFLNLTEKKFFLIHWGELMSGETTRNTSIQEEQVPQEAQPTPSRNNNQNSPRSTNPHLSE